MIIPTKLLKTPSMNENFSFIQSLAKKYHKVSNKNNKKITELSPLLEYSNMNATHAGSFVSHSNNSNNFNLNKNRDNNLTNSAISSSNSYYASPASIVPGFNSITNFYYNDIGYNHLNYSGYNSNKNNCFYNSNYYNNINSYNNNNFFKEEILNWLFNLSFQDRLKVLTIENKYLASMIHQMYLKYKIDNKVKFQIKNETFTDEEIYLQQIIASNNYGYSGLSASGCGIGNNNSIISNSNSSLNELSLDNFFNIKTEHYLKETGFADKLFLNEIIFFSSKENNDTFGLSPDMVNDKKVFTYNFDHFSGGKYFMDYCSVSYDQSYKLYNWNYPDWFKHKEYNSISVFIIAYLEQMICVKYWMYKEDMKDIQNCNKLVSNSYTITEDTYYNEIFFNRNKLINFLKEEYNNKDLFKNSNNNNNNSSSISSSSSVNNYVCNNFSNNKTETEKRKKQTIDIQEKINEVKNNTTLMNKVIKPASDAKNYYYLYKQKHDLLDPNYFDNERDIIKRIEEFYLTKRDEIFVDMLLFPTIEKLNTLEDFVCKQIYSTLLNMNVEKNAEELMLNIENDDKEKIKKKSKKRNKKKKEYNNNNNKLNIQIENNNKKLCSNISNNKKEINSEMSNNNINNTTNNTIVHHKETVFLEVNQENNTKYNNNNNNVVSNSCIDNDFNNINSSNKINNKDNNNFNFNYYNINNNNNNSKTHEKNLNSSNKLYINNLVNNIMKEVILTYNPCIKENLNKNIPNVDNNINSNIVSKKNNKNNNIDNIDNIKDISKTEPNHNKIKSLSDMSLNNENSNRNISNKKNNKKTSDIKCSFFLYPAVNENKKGRKHKKKNINNNNNNNINNTNENNNKQNDKFNFENIKKETNYNSNNSDSKNSSDLKTYNKKINYNSNNSNNNNNNLNNNNYFNYKNTVNNPILNKSSNSNNNKYNKKANNTHNYYNYNNKQSKQKRTKITSTQTTSDSINEIKKISNNNNTTTTTTTSKETCLKNDKLEINENIIIDNNNETIDLNSNNYNNKSKSKTNENNCNNYNIKKMVDSFCQTDYKKKIENVIVKSVSFEQREMNNNSITTNDKYCRLNNEFNFSKNNKIINNINDNNNNNDNENKMDITMTISKPTEEIELNGSSKISDNNNKNFSLINNNINKTIKKELSSEFTYINKSSSLNNVLNIVINQDKTKDINKNEDIISDTTNVLIESKVSNNINTKDDSFNNYTSQDLDNNNSKNCNSNVNNYKSLNSSCNLEENVNNYNSNYSYNSNSYYNNGSNSYSNKYNKKNKSNYYYNNANCSNSNNNNSYHNNYKQNSNYSYNNKFNNTLNSHGIKNNESNKIKFSSLTNKNLISNSNNIINSKNDISQQAYDVNIINNNNPNSVNYNPNLNAPFSSNSTIGKAFTFMSPNLINSPSSNNNNNYNNHNSNSNHNKTQHNYYIYNSNINFNNAINIPGNGFNYALNPIEFTNNSNINTNNNKISPIYNNPANNTISGINSSIYNNQISSNGGNYSNNNNNNTTNTTPSNNYNNSGGICSNNSWNRKLLFSHINIHNNGSDLANMESLVLKKVSFEEFSPCTFTNKLHNDIIDYSNNVTSYLDEVESMKNFSIKLINLALNNIISDVIQSTELYGSYATGISIESSDVDILVKLKNNAFDIENLINKVCVYFAGLKMFDSINPIATASVPVIKIVRDSYIILNNYIYFKTIEPSKLLTFINTLNNSNTFYSNNKDATLSKNKSSKDINIIVNSIETEVNNNLNHKNKQIIKSSSNIKQSLSKKMEEIKELIETNIDAINKFKSFLSSNKAKSYQFDNSDISKIKIDLSFLNTNVFGENNVVDFVKNQVKFNPEIKALMHVLKRYLSLNKLNSSFNGGLSSYSLLLMIMAYVRYPKSSNSLSNLGDMLNGFFEFYGKYFNFNQLIIDIANTNPIIMTSEYLESPIIIDPTTRKNVSKNSFRIEEVKDSLGYGFDFIQNQKIQYDKRCTKSNINIINELFSTINISNNCNEDQ